MSPSRRPLVVAIDGPSGVGKSTVARRLAAALGIPYLDTGAMYRALGLLVLDERIDPGDEPSVVDAARRAEIALRLDPEGRAAVTLDGRSVDAEIRTPAVGEATSRIAVYPGVRARLVELQRDLAGRLGGVIEGRDIGTRIVPEAPFKFFLDARSDVRARRRFDELQASGWKGTFEDVLAEQLARDERDRSRPVSPLTVTSDYTRLDTSDVDADTLVRRILDLIEQRGS